MKFTHISKKQVFKNDVITVFEEKLELPNNNIVTWTFTGKKEVVAIIAEIEGEIIFVKQYRPAIKKELLEIVRIPINEINIFSFEDSKTIIALSYLNMKNIVK